MASNNELTIRLKNLSAGIQKFIGKDAPAIAGKIAVNSFKKNFQDEGFSGKRWKEVQRRKSGTKTYKSANKHPADRRRKILTGRTGNLGRSIRMKVEPGKAVVYSDTPYGSYHNEGTAKLPKRQFIGNSRTLEMRIKTELEKQLSNILK